ncbi:MAG: ATP-binding cassette domain-containing protein [Thermomicrobiales bacterium]
MRSWTRKRFGGQELKGPRDYLNLGPLLLAGGIERAVTMSELLESRGFGGAPVRQRSPWLRLAPAVVLALFCVAAYLFAVVKPWSRLPALGGGRCCLPPIDSALRPVISGLDIDNCTGNGPIPGARWGDAGGHVDHPGRTASHSIRAVSHPDLAGGESPAGAGVARVARSGDRLAVVGAVATMSGGLDVVFESVSFRYPNAERAVLRDFDWEIGESELVLLAGASGSGKSTILRCLERVDTAFFRGSFGGRVLVRGEDTRMLPTRALARSVGFVFQDPGAHSVSTTVEDEVAFGLSNWVSRSRPCAGGSRKRSISLAPNASAGGASPRFQGASGNGLPLPRHLPCSRAFWRSTSRPAS